MEEAKFTHLDAQGNAIMVDVSGKEVTHREAVATGRIRLGAAVYQAVAEGVVKKGDVLGVARLGGIMGAKRTSELIPLCHILNLTKCGVEFVPHPESLEMEALCTVKCDGKTGVEMEALTGVSLALLTIYDMCKALDKGMVIGQIHLVEKTGGKSGHFLYAEKDVQHD
jgi:cyclic pyranopterin phosphate synthase